MAETEVESILREIRERVVSQQHAAQASVGNGSGDSGISAVVLGETNNSRSAENLALVNSQLTVTARAWDRLPPVVSNRSGAIARLELWLKRMLKRATHWYTWEQVNFNAAVHHALRDILPVLSAHEQELGKLRAQLAEAEVRISQLEQTQATLSMQLSALQGELRSATDTQSRALETQRTQTAAQLAELANELRERDQQRLDEQRVSFKQLALEASEATVLEDRARRKTETLLEELQRRVDVLKKG